MLVQVELLTVCATERGGVKPEIVREYRKGAQFIGIGGFVYAVDAVQILLGHEARGGDVCAQHELLDQFFRVAANARYDRGGKTVLTEKNVCFL